MDAIPILGDTKDALRTLTATLQADEYHVSEEYAQEIAQLRSDWHDEVTFNYSAQPEGGSKYLPQTAVIGVLNDFLGENDVILNAAGSVPGDLQRLWQCKGPKTYHVEYGNSTMGYEIPAGLGIKLVDPDREVYAIIGDGSYLMLHTEIVNQFDGTSKIDYFMF